ncbi:uncharacterized protein LOC123873951 [Maniola jurtina]|uniref:uncharacterized protein LOC123873951 n=1 Tax=Maniola jurtina TaxID=191418 RepID=UPI001E68E834|nr:uncharacterized protein LOC123873951 [Maniola jurtina]
MEAQKLKKKKNAISKGKIKKTIKNVICRPDPVYWPVVTEDEKSVLQTALEKHRVYIPEFKKPHWNDIKLMPKNERPQPPHIQKVDGLLFGISSCCTMVETQACSGVLIEANVNPQAIVQPIIEACTSSNIPVLCLNDLRNLCLTYFGIKTSCLGVKKNCLQDLSNKINEIFKNYKVEKKYSPIPISCPENESLIKKVKNEESPMDIDAYCPYVYRADRKSRAFVPDAQQDAKANNQFTGQHYIKLPQETKSHKDRKAYLKMILKKVSSNPHRVKVKQES